METDRKICPIFGIGREWLARSLRVLEGNLFDQIMMIPSLMEVGVDSIQLILDDIYIYMYMYVCMFPVHVYIVKRAMDMAIKQNLMMMMMMMMIWWRRICTD